MIQVGADVLFSSHMKAFLDVLKGHLAKLRLCACTTVHCAGHLLAPQTVWPSWLHVSPTWPKALSSSSYGTVIAFIIAGMIERSMSAQSTLQGMWWVAHSLR
jgi:hypothetical protein